MRWLCLPLATLALALLIPASSIGHVERSSYWPDPAADTSISPPAGGAVPVARSLGSALRKAPPGKTRVVCKRDSLRQAYASIRAARREGYRLRPSLPLKKLTKKQARRQRKLNRKFFRRCRFRHIQAAVLKSGNNDRVVVMPGKYLEEPSRAQPTNDPKCANLREESENGAGAASFKYQASCPNDQSLIYVGGRAVTDKPVPNPPNEPRFGIPDEGPCIRCNLQIEGSGVTPLDVLIDAAKSPNAELRRLHEAAKDVVVRMDRADGIVIKNMTGAHAREHAFYVHETDGYLLDDFKVFYNGEYGTLTFTSDHGLTSDCEGVGHGDSAVYPGAAPDTGEQRQEPAQRLSQAITRCDLHHNTLGYSGTMGNGTHVYGNNFYDNTVGITTDSFFAGGHPGFPQDSAVFENNNIYSNNFNSYTADSDVKPRIPVPTGTGIFIAGGNGNEIRGNRIWDNWRRGTMLLAVPEALAGAPGTAGGTSNRNRYHDNVVGIAPDGSRKPNGTDFWWDEFPGNTDNCWFDNGQVTSDPPTLPSNCTNTSSGATYPVHSGGELVPCLAGLEAGAGYDPNTCPWFVTPPQPGSSTRSASARSVAHLEPLAGDLCRLYGDSTLSCDPFRGVRP